MPHKIPPLFWVRSTSTWYPTRDLTFQPFSSTSTTSTTPMERQTTTLSDLPNRESGGSRCTPLTTHTALHPKPPLWTQTTSARTPRAPRTPIYPGLQGPRRTTFLIWKRRTPPHPTHTPHPSLPQTTSRDPPHLCADPACLPRTPDPNLPWNSGRVPQNVNNLKFVREIIERPCGECRLTGKFTPFAS